LIPGVDTFAHRLITDAEGRRPAPVDDYKLDEVWPAAALEIGYRQTP